MRNVNSNGWKKMYMLLQGQKLYTTKKVSHFISREPQIVDSCIVSIPIFISHLIRCMRFRTDKRISADFSTELYDSFLTNCGSEYELWALNVPRRKNYSALLATQFKRAHYLPFCGYGSDVLKYEKTSLHKEILLLNVNKRTHIQLTMINTLT